MIKPMSNSFKIPIKNKLVTFTFLGRDMLPSFNEVTSVMAIPFTESGELVIIDLYNRGWDFPGGHVDPGETSPQQTLRREVMEEASMTLHSPYFVQAVGSDYFDDKASYMLFYTAYVDELLDFKQNDESSSRIITDLDTFINHYEAGDKQLVRQMIKEAWELLTKSS